MTARVWWAFWSFVRQKLVRKGKIPSLFATNFSAQQGHRHHDVVPPPLSPPEHVAPPRTPIYRKRFKAMDQRKFEYQNCAAPTPGKEYRYINPWQRLTTSQLYHILFRVLACWNICPWWQAAVERLCFSVGFLVYLMHISWQHRGQWPERGDCEEETDYVYNRRFSVISTRSENPLIRAPSIGGCQWLVASTAPSHMFC